MSSIIISSVSGWVIFLEVGLVATLDFTTFIVACQAICGKPILECLDHLEVVGIQWFHLLAALTLILIWDR